MDIKNYDLRQAFSIEKTILLYSGFYPKTAKVNNWLYYLIYTSCLLISWLIVIFILVGQVTSFNDISALSEALLFFATQVAFLAKLSSIMYYKENFTKIEYLLTKPIFYGFSEHQVQLIINAVNDTEFVAKIYRYICIISVICYSIFPFLDQNSDISMPLPTWHPWDITKSTIYYSISFGFHIISIAISALYNSTADIITVKMYTLAAAQFQILKDNLNKIDYTNKKALKQLRRNFIYHQEVLNYIHLIQQTFSYGIFVQFIASVLVICFVAFKMLIVPVQSMEFVHLFIYLSCMLNQVALYCWYGHGVMTESENVGNASYMTNWYRSDASIRKMLFIFMERCKIPVVLKAGKFFPLNLLTFKTIMRSSYSYFAVLQRVYNVEQI